jgi:hypothetical protein
MSTSGSRSFYLVDVIAETCPEADSEHGAGKTTKEKDQPFL